MRASMKWSSWAASRRTSVFIRLHAIISKSHSIVLVINRARFESVFSRWLLKAIKFNRYVGAVESRKYFGGWIYDLTNWLSEAWTLGSQWRFNRFNSQPNASSIVSSTSRSVKWSSLDRDERILNIFLMIGCRLLNLTKNFINLTVRFDSAQFRQIVRILWENWIDRFGVGLSTWLKKIMSRILMINSPVWLLWSRPIVLVPFLPSISLLACSRFRGSSSSTSIVQETSSSKS